MQDAAVMVTGGAGFVGQHVVRRLAQSGRTVVAVYHHKLPESFERVYPVCADFSSAELMAAPLRGVDTVVHLAWEGGLAGPHADETTPSGDVAHLQTEALSPNLRMLRHLITAMERSGSRRLILLSAVGANKEAGSTFLREKYWAESLLLNAKIPEKIILRSTLVWGGQGHDDRFLRSMLRVMRYPLYPLPVQKESVSLVHVTDLAEIVARSCSHRLAQSSCLLAVDGGEAYALPELFKLVSDRCVKRPRLPVSGFLGKSLLPLLERDRGHSHTTPKLNDFLTVGRCIPDGGSRLGNPLAVIVPQTLASFREKILD